MFRKFQELDKPQQKGLLDLLVGHYTKNFFENKFRHCREFWNAYIEGFDNPGRNVNSNYGVGGGFRKTG